MQTKTLKIIFTAISIGLMLPATNAFAIQADDGTAHHAIIYSGMGINNILFSTDGSIGHIDHGTIVGSNRIVTAGTNTGAVTIAIDNNYDGTLTDITAGNVAHTDVSDTYTVKDSDSYCWDVTYSMGTYAYTAVVETAKTAGDNVLYGTACANVTPAAVQAPFASYLAIPFLFATFTGIGFIANTRKKTQV